MRTDATTLGLGVAALVVLVAIAGVPAPVSAHVNDVGVDSQVSADGTVVVETAFIGTDGFVVLHEVNGSDTGEPIGHAPVSEEGGLKQDITVDVEAGTWRNWSGDRRVWAVLHADDGDGEFEPADDEMLEQFGDPVGEWFTLERGDAAAYVTAREFAAQPTDDGTVRIRAAALPSDGHVVLRRDAGDAPGEFVGSTNLSAGTTRNVTVALDEEFFRAQEGSFTLYASLYPRDGDGSVDQDDRPFQAGSDAVATRFGVEKTGGPTPTATTAEDDHADGHEHDHDSTGSATTGTTAGDDPPFSLGDGAGFGLPASLLAVVLLATGWRLRH